MNILTRNITEENSAYDFIKYYYIWKNLMKSGVDTEILPTQALIAIIIANAIDRDFVQKIFYGAAVYRNLVMEGDYSECPTLELAEMHGVVKRCLKNRLDAEAHKELTEMLRDEKILEKIAPENGNDSIDLYGKILIYGYQEKLFSIKEI